MKRRRGFLMQTNCLSGQCPFCIGPISIHSELGQAFRKWLIYMPGSVARLAGMFSECGLSESKTMPTAEALVQWCCQKGYLAAMGNIIMQGPSFKHLREGMDHSLPSTDPRCESEWDDDLPF